MLSRRSALPAALLCSVCFGFGADLYVSLDGSHIPPFGDWSTAATNIQAAVDAAAVGDRVWVSNGVYRVGGTLNPTPSITNRVVVNKAITLQSLNGPQVTSIEGFQSVPGTNSSSSIRCVWLGDGATLSGFTLTNGATAASGPTGDGAGAWCHSLTSVITNCIVVRNGAYGRGGGVFQGTVQSCVIKSNVAFSSGGGTYGAWVYSSDVLGNRGGVSGGGGMAAGVAKFSRLIGNFASSGGGALYVSLQNSEISGNSASVMGGGAYCQGSNSFNCLISGNSATNSGGGVAYGLWSNCVFQGNSSRSGGGASYRASIQDSVLRANTAQSGGGADFCDLTNCCILANVATDAGGAYGSDLLNCTVIGNSAPGTGGIANSSATNSIIFYNSGNPPNYNLSPMTFSCSDPAPGPAQGNSIINIEPRLMSDGMHLLSDSPCIGRGRPGSGLGVDVDGQAWNNPPSIGADEWKGTPMIVSQPRVVPSSQPRLAVLQVEVAGQDPYCWWTKDSAPIDDNSHYQAAHSTRVTVANFDTTDAGSYQVVVSNTFGFATSSVVTVTVACVDGGSASPAAPYASWGTAAQTIQDAIDASAAGTVVLVTNGIYATGGRPAPGDPTTNRVVLNKPLTLISVNGRDETFIDGAWTDGTPNGYGSNSVRCVWMADGAIIGGFTLRNGSTQTNGAGVWSAGLGLQDSVVACVISNCSAGLNGGGAYQGRLRDCVVAANSGFNGGGLAWGQAFACDFHNNSARQNGGAAYQSYVHQSSLFSNNAPSGGGLYSGQASVCMIATNTGAGVYSGTARNCQIIWNQGNGLFGSYAIGSLIRGNSSVGAVNSTNLNCTFLQNAVAVNSGTHTNCIFWFNNAIGASIRRVNCLSPEVGPGTTTSVLPLFPNLLSDGWHLAGNSPAIGRGLNWLPLDPDLDGQSWSNAPAIGSDQWNPAPLIISPPRVLPGSAPGQARLSIEVAGQPSYCWWTKDGTVLTDNTHYTGVQTSSVAVQDFGPADAGAYQVVVSNIFGAATSTVSAVTVLCVNATSAAPTFPYGTWDTAATNIQDAVDAATTAAVVLVTKGIYNTGARPVPGDATLNRLVVDKALTVLAVGSRDSTVIEGAWDPALTNGPGSIRCAWIKDGGCLGWFTLRNGSSTTNGGGIFNEGLGLTDSVVGCLITNCSAGASGGGVWQGRVRNSLILGNIAATGGGTAESFVEDTFYQGNYATNGGGASGGVIRRCKVLQNGASNYGGGVFGPGVVQASALALNTALDGGGAYYVSMFNSTVVSNTASRAGSGGGASFCNVWNSILYYNSALNIGPSGDYQNICYTPYSVVVRGITNNPQILDLSHIAITSPCLGAGTNLGFLGTADIDSEMWNAPPSIGCDEPLTAGLIGPLSVQLLAWPTVALGGRMPLTANITGRATTLQWNFGDGVIVTDDGYNTSHIWTNVGDYQVTATVYNLDHPSGVSSSATIHVVPMVLPALTVAAFSNSVFSVQFGGQPGLTYDLQRTTDLADTNVWQTVESVNSSGATEILSDSNAAAAAGFYRLMIH